jgi:heme/copper-type cytochrome/quinol oxidase subunit 1
VNPVIHNTAWVPGHLHLTVGSAVTLSPALIVLAYGPVLYEAIRTAEYTSPSYVLW